MKFNLILTLILAVCLALAAGTALAQDAQPEPAAAAEAAVAAEEELEWGDYTVKAYSLTVWGGGFSGATYLDLKPLGDRTVLTDGAGHVLGFDGEVLEESTARFADQWDAPRKEIKAGDAFGARIGIYIAEDFHLDLMASYATGEAITSMQFTDTNNVGEELAPVRLDVDSDPGFKVYRGGIAMMYNAKPATMFGIVPRLGFGLGGIINRFSELEDKTALYLEGNFGLTYELFDGVDIAAQVDLTNFAFEVDELGYSDMINYTTYSIGVSWFIDRVPEQVRAAHRAEKN